MPLCAGQAAGSGSHTRTCTVLRPCCFAAARAAAKASSLMPMLVSSVMSALTAPVRTICSCSGSYRSQLGCCRGGSICRAARSGWVASRVSAKEWIYFFSPSTNRQSMAPAWSSARNSSGVKPRTRLCSISSACASDTVYSSGRRRRISRWASSASRMASTPRGVGFSGRGPAGCTGWFWVFVQSSAR